MALRVLYKARMGINAYRVTTFAGYKILSDVIRPLPPIKPGGRRRDWDAEHKALVSVIRARTEAIGVPMRYHPLLTLPNASARVKCFFLCRRFSEYIPSMPVEAFEAKPEPRRPVWSEKIRIERGANPITQDKQSDRLLFIKNIPLEKLPAIREAYPCMRNAAGTTPVPVYQCTCGRYLAVPKRFGKPDRGGGSCGCLVHRFVPFARRTKQERRLDALREYITMYLACTDPDCYHHDPGNVFKLPSFTVFAEWYGHAVVHKLLSNRFVCRGEPDKPFAIDNLRFCNADKERRRETYFIKL